MKPPTVAERSETAGDRHTRGAISANCTMKNIGTRGFAGDPKSYLCSAANKRSESLYQWEWQTGRLLRKTGMTDDAIGSYRRAVRTLQSIRPELSVSYGAPQDSFRETMGPLYFELVDLLLQRAASLQERDQVAPYLH